MRRPRRALVVCDDRETQHSLATFLEGEGYEIDLALTGSLAVERFDAFDPKLVFVEADLSGLSGYDVTRRIKARAGDRYVPVIFVSDTEEPERIVRCYECGADAVIGLPLNPELLHAHLAAIERTAALHVTLQHQRDDLRHHYRRLSEEQRIAEAVYASITAMVGPVTSGVRTLTTAKSLFNGDLVFSARSPDGGVHVLIGDCTGHGLAAAIGALPVHDVFLTMTKKGFAIEDIVVELNRKLRRLLPTGWFCAATLLSLEPEANALRVWSGGQPLVWLRGADGGIRERISSNEVALGIVDEDRFDSRCQIFTLEPGEQVYACTDGAMDARNAEGERFGESRIEAAIAARGPSDGVLERVNEAIAIFSQDGDQPDDVTFVQLEHGVADERVIENGVGNRCPPFHWRSAVHLDADALRSTDPVPPIIAQAVGIQSLEEERASLFTILSELVTNAVDHGLLGLDSSIKLERNGFQAYYEQRRQRLDELQVGSLVIELSHRPDRQGTGGLLAIRVSDTGDGFDPETAVERFAPGAPCGRGIPLVRSLCRSLEFSDRGRVVEAQFAWSRSADAEDEPSPSD